MLVWPWTAPHTRNVTSSVSVEQPPPSVVEKGSWLTLNLRVPVKPGVDRMVATGMESSALSPDSAAVPHSLLAWESHRERSVQGVPVTFQVTDTVLSPQSDGPKLTELCVVAEVRVADTDWADATDDSSR